jgi:hypothetical protein
MVDRVDSYETFVIMSQTTQHHTPENSNLHMYNQMASSLICAQGYKLTDEIQTYIVMIEIGNKGYIFILDCFYYNLINL